MYFTEIFKVNLDKLPSLFAYQMLTRGNNQQVSTGRKLADRMRRTFGGHWVWTDNVIVTDFPQEQSKLEEAIRSIRMSESNTFKDLARFVLLDNWLPSKQALADFVAQGLFWDLGFKFQDALRPPVTLRGGALVERDFNIRGWVVRDQPAVSISIESRILLRDDLKTYMSRLDEASTVIDLWVADKVPFDNGTTMKGAIVSIAGRLDVDIPRQDLLDLAQREESKHFIKTADEGEYVVRVGQSEYEYVVGALRVIAFPKHYKRFGIDSKQAQNATWISPGERVSFVRKLSEIARGEELIGDPFTEKDKRVFYEAPSFRYDPTILLGNNARMEYKGGVSLINAIGRFGQYSYSDSTDVERDLRIGVLNASPLDLAIAQQALVGQLRTLGYGAITVTEVKTKGISRIDLERGIEELRTDNPDIVVAVIPDSDSLDEDDWGPYFDFKSLMMQLEIPSQVIDQNTLRNAKSLPYVMQNVAFGISAKVGNIPYVLANQIDYADSVVGIDIARKRNRSGVGTQNAAAIAQVFHNTGQFLQCRIVETPLEGETVPGNVLRSLFPLNEFQEQRVIIHRDGPFRGNEVEIIQEHLAALNAEVYFVEVIKSGAPRLYRLQGEQSVAPGIGTAFILNETEAFLVASSASRGTPSPIQVRTRAPFTIAKALNSVLMLTLMHYGSLRRPKLPITIHYSDRIGYLALRGVKPAGGHSSDMYWL